MKGISIYLYLFMNDSNVIEVSPSALSEPIDNGYNKYCFMNKFKSRSIIVLNKTKLKRNAIEEETEISIGFIVFLKKQ